MTAAADGVFRLWGIGDVRNPVLLTELRVGEPLEHAEFSADDQLIALGASGRVYVFHVTGLQDIAEDPAAVGCSLLDAGEIAEASGLLLPGAPATVC